MLELSIPLHTPIINISLPNGIVHKQWVNTKMVISAIVKPKVQIKKSVVQTNPRVLYVVQSATVKSSLVGHQLTIKSKGPPTQNSKVVKFQSMYEVHTTNEIFPGLWLIIISKGLPPTTTQNSKHQQENILRHGSLIFMQFQHWYSSGFGKCVMLIL